MYWSDPLKNLWLGGGGRKNLSSLPVAQENEGVWLGRQE